MILLYIVASHRPWEGLKLFWGRNPPSSQDQSPIGKTFYQILFLLFLLKTKIKDLVLTSQVAASPISLSSKVFLPEA